MSFLHHTIFTNWERWLAVLQDCMNNCNVTLGHHMSFFTPYYLHEPGTVARRATDCTDNFNVTLGHHMCFLISNYLHELGTAARRKTKPPSAVHALSRAVRFYKGFLEVILFNLLVFRIFKNFFKTLKITCS